MKVEKEVKAETIINVVAYETPPKDSQGNLQKDEDGKTVKGAVLGTDTTYQYSKDQKGLNVAIKRDGIASVVDNHNRQKKTDCRNTIAADAKNAKDPDKKIKRAIAKTSKSLTEAKRAELNTKLAELLAGYEELDKE